MLDQPHRESLLVSHTQRYRRFHRTCGHVWQGRFKSPVIQDDDHLLTVLRYIEANPLRARIVERAGDSPWSSFACHGLGRSDPLLDRLPGYDALASYPAARQRRWSAYVHHARGGGVGGHSPQQPDGPPLWRVPSLDRLCRQFKLDLTIRPRGRPRKDAKARK